MPGKFHRKREYPLRGPTGPTAPGRPAPRHRRGPPPGSAPPGCRDRGRGARPSPRAGPGHPPAVALRWAFPRKRFRSLWRPGPADTGSREPRPAPAGAALPLPARGALGGPPCRPRPDTRAGRGSHAGASPLAPPRADPRTATRARSARRGRPCLPVPLPAAALRSPVWPHGSGRGPWRRTTPRDRGPRPRAGASRERGPPGPAPGPRPGRAPPAKRARPRRSGSPCSSRRERRRRGSARAGARWRRRGGRTARQSRRRGGPAPR